MNRRGFLRLLSISAAIPALSALPHAGDSAGSGRGLEARPLVPDADDLDWIEGRKLNLKRIQAIYQFWPLEWR